MRLLWKNVSCCYYLSLYLAHCMLLIENVTCSWKINLLLNVIYSEVLTLVFLLTKLTAFYCLILFLSVIRLNLQIPVIVRYNLVQHRKYLMISKIVHLADASWLSNLVCLICELSAYVAYCTIVVNVPYICSQY